MKKTFAGKSKNMTFLGLAVLMSAAAVLLHSCNKKTEKITEQKLPKPKPTAKVEEPITASDKRTIYLTFDDGPNKGTDNLIKIIHKHKVSATAFIVGKHVFGSKKQAEEFEKLKQDTLIELANHSFTHANNNYSSFYENSEKVLLDFNKARDSVKFKNNYARTP